MRENYFEDGKWWVSSYNFIPEVRSKMNLPETVQIHDATLRDGEQTPGVVFSIDDKIAIASKLDELGVDRIEAGMPAVSPQDAEAIKQISQLGLKSKIFTFARAMKADIDMAIACGADGVIIEVPIGYPKLKTQFGWTWEVVHSCANGLGERTGNAALEELMMGLHILYGYDTKYKLDKTPELGALIAERSNVPIARNKPVLGHGNFIRESGIGIDLVMNDPLVMFGTHPSLTGKSGEVVLGKNSGKASIIYKMKELGMPALEDAMIADILVDVKSAGIAKRSVLSEEEFRNIVAAKSKA
ncbi:hypothetical protein [Falsihalocynthiibacter arcticus]|uniref:Homocitrate synthase n=1 Tax=Falsihalocynthiibacter arcticus TaxID=1579316 RepID=A0A126V152_9RHOB|nr:hypothetical protein [Falsihalocynthiibacter arcticus]AML52024.1 hypothetical protein RC74_12750 [Falsihalocynthiibacter arcticus]